MQEVQNVERACSPQFDVQPSLRIGWERVPEIEQIDDRFITPRAGRRETRDSRWVAGWVHGVISTGTWDKVTLTHLLRRCSNSAQVLLPFCLDSPVADDGLQDK